MRYDIRIVLDGVTTTVVVGSSSRDEHYTSPDAVAAQRKFLNDITPSGGRGYVVYQDGVVFYDGVSFVSAETMGIDLPDDGKFDELETRFLEAMLFVVRCKDGLAWMRHYSLSSWFGVFWKQKE